jgi:hypothetical protein
MPVRKSIAAVLLGALILAGCAGTGPAKSQPPPAGLTFGPELRPGRPEASPAWPFMRIAPDGRLYLVWTEKDQTHGAAPSTTDNTAHNHNHAPDSNLRAAYISASMDDGQTWSAPLRINDQPENVQGDENEAKIAFGKDGQLYTAWAIPDPTGNKMKATIRFSMLDQSGQFKPAQSLNEVPNAARFVALQTAPDGTVLAAWIDRRVDSPAPRQIDMTRLSPTGEVLTQNYQVADDSCECCRIMLAFADNGKTVYLSYRQKPANNIRNIVVRKSTDGGATFGAPVVVSDDGWEIAGCPHSGAVMATDARGNLHVIWFTMGRKPAEAGIYYSVSTDGGATFSKRQLVEAANGTGVLRPYLAVSEQGDVYVAWTNYVEGTEQTHIFFRHMPAGATAMSPVQQVSQAEGNAVWPNLAASEEKLYLSWTVQKEDATWVGLRVAPITKP